MHKRNARTGEFQIYIFRYSLGVYATIRKKKLWALPILVISGNIELLGVKNQKNVLVFRLCCTAHISACNNADVREYFFFYFLIFF